MFSAPEKQLREIASEMEQAADLEGGLQQEILASIGRAILRGPIREQFRSGVGPTGPWVPTARGAQALQSNKLANAFTAEVVGADVRFQGVVKRNWLEAHQIGHRFAARAVEGNKQWLTFNRAGRLIRNKRALNKAGTTRRGVYQTFAKAHSVGARVLPARPIIPTGTSLPQSWEEAALRSGRRVVGQWAERLRR